jgi:phosphoadenosine phosphosulfate reductase
MEQNDAALRAADLNLRYENIDGTALLRALIREEFPGKIAVLSSFGAESAVLLALVAEVDPAIPVIFLDTGKLFEETLAYRETLTRMLGLTDVRIVSPAADAVEAQDPEGVLWYWDADRCCALRKVQPMNRAVAGFDAVISGRKRYHGALRSFMPLFEAVDGRIKVDPIAHWSREQVDEAFASRRLPRHPLVAEGFQSIGCAPCTQVLGDAENVRAGRWAGRPKTECGIHLSTAQASAGAA